MRKELLEGLTDEQIAKLSACKNIKEILKLAKSEGVELNEEQLGAIYGGCSDASDEDEKCCPKCHSYDNNIFTIDKSTSTVKYICNKCGYLWTGRVTYSHH